LYLSYLKLNFLNMYCIKYRSTSSYSNTEQIYKIYKNNNNEYGDKNGKP